MPGVQDIETTVGHHHPLAAGLRLPNQRLQRSAVDQLAPAFTVPVQRRAQFVGADGGDAEFPDHQASG